MARLLYSAETQAVYVGWLLLKEAVNGLSILLLSCPCVMALGLSEYTAKDVPASHSFFKGLYVLS